MDQRLNSSRIQALIESLAAQRRGRILDGATSPEYAEVPPDANYNPGPSDGVGLERVQLQAAWTIAEVKRKEG